MLRVIAKQEKTKAGFSRVVHLKVYCRPRMMEARLHRNLHRLDSEEFIVDLGHLMEDPSSTRSHKTSYTKKLTLLWYTKDLLGKAISKSVIGKI